MSLKFTNIKKPDLLSQLGIFKRPFSMRCDYRGDGFGTKGKSRKFMDDPKFIAAWTETSKRYMDLTGNKAPDVRWRAHTALWAAQNGLAREGDFVECGVFSGLFSGMICHYFDFARQDKTFWLFDTWAGIPTEDISDKEKKVADGYNKGYHNVDIYEEVQKAFAPYPNCRLMRGKLPGTLDEAHIEKIAYLCMDLNNATYERACIEALWPKLVSGAVVLLDDYNFSVCHLQQDMWDAFAKEKGTMVAALPTGQGIIIKP